MRRASTIMTMMLVKLMQDKARPSLLKPGAPKQPLPKPDVMGKAALMSKASESLGLLTALLGCHRTTRNSTSEGISFAWLRLNVV